MKLAALLLLAGCAPTWRPATGTGKATVSVHVFTVVALDGQRIIRRRIATVNNPSPDEVVLDCGALRVRFPAGKAADVLLLPYDRGCDLMNDTTYVPIEDVTSVMGALKAK